MLRILIVDDERNVLKALDEILRDEGYEVRTASSGPEALKLAADFRPHLLLTDLRLPGMNGLELIAAVRQLAPAPTALLMSASERPRRCDVQFVEKPIDLDRLLATLAAAA
jgi:CheY-like chemotaxis protein